MLTEIQYLIFDLDGTLIDTREVIAMSLNTAFQKHIGQVFPIIELQKSFGLSISEIFIKYAKDKARDCEHTYTEEYLTHFTDHARLYPNTLEVLDELIKRGYQMSIVTSKSRIRTTRELEYFALTSFMDAVVTEDDTTIHKPNPEPILKALDLVGRSSFGAVYIGDAPTDIIAGRKAGVLTMAVTWGYHSLEELEKCNPDFMIMNICDLLNICVSPNNHYATL